MKRENITDYLDELEAQGFISNRKFLFVDTCAILDILRERTHTKQDSVHFFEKYQKIIDGIKSNDIFVVSSFMVAIESRSNYDAIKQDYQNNYNNIINKIKALQDLSVHRKMISRRVKYDDRYYAFTFAENLYKELLELITFFEEKIEYDSFALLRVEQKLPPAHKKHEYKDAFIWKTCLDLKDNIKDDDTIFFYTTNTEDYVIGNGLPAAEKERCENQFNIDCAGKIKIVTNMNCLTYLLFGE